MISSTKAVPNPAAREVTAARATSRWAVAQRLIAIASGRSIAVIHDVHSLVVAAAVCQLCLLNKQSIVSRDATTYSDFGFPFFVNGQLLGE